MSSGPSLYRRHRPRSFADLIGQEPVVRTLRNAVQRDKVHHAYLFVGSRGTGKTSTAKILAACLNCENGPTIEPCGVCESCRSIASATSLDVIEMDAASNNSVDDIRELRESVAFAPVSGRHKVYILDEAHMLSTAAWNAFLKTLEEPPPSTVFVLATTEAHKVPATVVDRCHRFDFQRPAVSQIALAVRRVADSESVAIPPAAVAAIARAAEGSFRDALGTLEQLVTYSGTEIAVEDVLAVLGIADAELLASTFDAVGGGDARAAMLAIHACCDGGRDAAAFATDLEGRARDLLVVQTLGGVPEELSLTPEADESLLAQAQHVPQSAIVRTLELLAVAREAVRAGGDPRTQLELALVKAASPELDGSTQALLLRIERLEAALAARPAVSAPQPASPLPVAQSPAPSPAAQAPPPQVAEVAATHGLAVNGAATPPDSPAPSTPVLAAAPHAAAPADAGAVSEAVAAPSFSGPVELGALQTLWPAVIDVVRVDNSMLAAALAQARPAELDGDSLTVVFPTSADFLKNMADGAANTAKVVAALAQVSGQRLRPRYELRDDVAPVEQVAPALTEEQWVARFVDEFDAEELPVPQPEGE